jgi:Secretion system C-terminal sorting domain
MEVYFKRSPDEGISWDADLRLTNSPTILKNYPKVSISGTIVNIVWEDPTGGHDIYYKRSPNSGNTWGADIQFTNSSGISTNASLSASDQNVHIVWADTRDSNSEIYYKRSTNGGVSWGTDTRLTNNVFGSGRPCVSVSGSVVNVVWEDNRDSVNASEIYYKRNPTGNPIGIINISTGIPSSFSLGQNYPNPFNPTTVIRFSLSGVSNTLLKVCDVTGKEVETLVNERLQAGTYESTFDGSRLASGVYFYKLITEEFSETKKMLMLK